MLCSRLRANAIEAVLQGDNALWRGCHGDRRSEEIWVGEHQLDEARRLLNATAHAAQCHLRECSGAATPPAVRDDTANHTDDSPTDGIQSDYADQQECEDHEGGAALTGALSPCDRDFGNAHK